MYGGLNGGTLASALNMAESGTSAKMRGAVFLRLSPGAERALQEVEREPVAASFDNDVGAWVAPFVMSTINTRVVRRSSQILGLDFAYQEYVQMKGSLAAPMAFGLAMGGALFEAGLRFSPVRSLLRAVAPAPGSGPSDKTMDRGWFRCYMVARSSDERTARALIADKGDPGNRGDREMPMRVSVGAGDG